MNAVLEAALKLQVETLKESVELRNKIIEKQQEMIEILKKELNRKRKWYQIWRW